jgi:hypothetical protein
MNQANAVLLALTAMSVGGLVATVAHDHGTASAAPSRAYDSVAADVSPPCAPIASF